MTTPPPKPGKDKAYTWFELGSFNFANECKVKCATTITEKEDNSLFLGSDDGRIFKYSYTNEEVAIERRRVGHSVITAPLCQRTLRKGKQVTQLDSFPDPSNLLFALCDNKLFVIENTENSLNVKEDLNLPLNEPSCLVNNFALCKTNPQCGVFQLKSNPKVIHLYRISGTGGFKIWRSFTLSDVPTFMFFQYPILIVTFKTNFQYFYIDLDLELKKPAEYLPQENPLGMEFGKNSNPLATIVSEQERDVNKQKIQVDLEIVLTKDTKAYFNGFINGRPSQSPTRDIFSSDSNIDFQAHPSSLIVDEPYMISLQEGMVEVHNVFSRKLEDSFPFTANCICFDKQFLFLCSDTRLHCLIPQPIERRVKTMIDAGHVDGAIKLFSNARQYQKREEIYTYAGDHFFKELKFENAFLKYYYATKDSILPKRLIRLYPGLSDKPSDAPDLVIANLLEATQFQKDKKDTLMIQAKNELLTYLLKLKTEHKIKPDNELECEMSLAIIKLHADVRSEELQTYLNKNQVDDPSVFREIQDYLTSLERWNALAILHRNKKIYKEALVIWQDIGSEKKEGDKSNAVEETVKLLSKINDTSLLKEFSPWVKDANFKKFKSIWKRYPKNEPLIPQMVISFLDEFSPTTKMFYLKYLVHTEHSTDQIHHVSLAEMYLTMLLSTINEHNITPQKLVDMEELLDQEAQALPMPAISSVILTTRGVMGRQRGATVAIKQAEENVFKLRKNFMKLIRESPFFGPQSPQIKNLINKIKDTNLRYEKIELYDLSNDHEQSLRIICEEDYERAEKYCLQFKEPIRYEKDVNPANLNHLDKAGYSCFMDSLGYNPRLLALLKIHISKSNYNEASELLKRYPSLFNPVEVLHVLPPHMPLKEVSSFLSTSVKQTMHQYHYALATKNIEYSMSVSRSYERAKIVELTSKFDKDLYCAVTRERIWDQPFYRYPNGKIVLIHKNDNFDKNVCPVTKVNFLERPFKFDV